MLANQTLVARDGYEVALFPMDVLNMTQDEGGDFSHSGTYNIDFVGTHASYPIYAPCTMIVVATRLTYDGGNAVTFESVHPVHLPNGALDYLTIDFAHDPNPPYTTVGTVVAQGNLCYHTGSYGHVTGDHVHSCLGQGQYQGLTQRSTGNWDLTNRIHYWDGVYVNDTNIIQGYNHDWRTWTEPTPPPIVRKKDKFPFIIAKHHWRGWGKVYK